jgi:hypothetical protein
MINISHITCKDQKRPGYTTLTNYEYPIQYTLACKGCHTDLTRYSRRIVYYIRRITARCFFYHRHPRLTFRSMVSLPGLFPGSSRGSLHGFMPLFFRTLPFPLHRSCRFSWGRETAAVFLFLIRASLYESLFNGNVCRRHRKCVRSCRLIVSCL